MEACGYIRTSLIFLLGGFFLPFAVHAQAVPFSHGLQIGVDAYYGKLLKHSPQMEFTLPEPLSGVSVEVMKQTFGQDYWSGLYRYPRVGWVFHMHRFGNPEVLGTAWATYPQLDIFLLRKPRFSSFLRMGYGIAYVTKPYNRVNNPTNVAIGSHLNNLTTAGIGIEFRPATSLLLRFGAHLTHVSNGKIMLPNLGINSASLRLGLSYELAPPPEFLPFDKEAHPKCKKWLPHLRLGLGLTESKVPDGPKYHVFILSGYVGHMLSRKSKLQLGMEASFSYANHDWLKNQDIQENDNPDFQPWRVAAFAGHELVFGRFSFLTQAQFYLDPPFATQSFVAVKLGPNVYLLPPHQCKPFNVFFGIYLKSHFQVAQMVEATCGVSF